MRNIKAVLFEPVGCLAEFPADPFHQIASSVFEDAVEAGTSGSEAYWHVVDLLESIEQPLTPSQRDTLERLECQAVDMVELYEDVIPSLGQLRLMSVDLLIASSMSSSAIDRFLKRFDLGTFFSSVWTRDSAGGTKDVPMAKAIERSGLQADQIMCLVDTLESLEIAKQVGANSILMINEYEEGRRLAMQAPTGGIVSLHELPDAIRLIDEKTTARRLRS